MMGSALQGGQFAQIRKGAGKVRLARVPRAAETGNPPDCKGLPNIPRWRFSFSL